jgi:nitroreductase
MLKDLILKTRSCRRFVQDEPVAAATLKELVDLARLSASARNAQPLKYYLSVDPKTNAEIFKHLSWAAFLKNWDGPEEGERPAAYIVVLHDTEIASNYFCDDGIASQSIALGATEKGLSCCIVGSVDRLPLQKALGLASHLRIVHVIAVGKAKETIVVEKLSGNDYKYWRDEKGVHHVPKRDLDDLIVG